MIFTKNTIALLSLCALAMAPTNATTLRDLSRYSSSWATQTSVNLYRCSSSTIRSKTDIERFIRNVCNYLGLTRNGSTEFTYHYAGNGYTSGLSATQQANGHTSISIHVNERDNTIYLDFFSCMAYDSYEIARRAQDFFYAQDMSYDTMRR